MSSWHKYEVCITHNYMDSISNIQVYEEQVLTHTKSKLTNNVV